MPSSCSGGIFFFILRHLLFLINFVTGSITSLRTLERTELKCSGGFRWLHGKFWLAGIANTSNLCIAGLSYLNKKANICIFLKLYNNLRDIVRNLLSLSNVDDLMKVDGITPQYKSKKNLSR